MTTSKTTDKILQAVIPSKSDGAKSSIYEFTDEQYATALLEYSRYKNSEQYNQLELVASQAKAGRADVENQKEGKRSAISGWVKGIFLVILAIVLTRVSTHFFG
jgi:hypothetical protein